MFKAFVAAAAGLLLVTACGRSGPFSDMQQGERGRVVRIIDGDALVLDTGQSVRLVGLEAPAMNWREKDPEPYAEASSRMLDDLVMGRAVRLYYPGMTRDRYDRALAHVETADAKGPHYWLNAEMLRRGGARLRIYPDTDRARSRWRCSRPRARRWPRLKPRPVHKGRGSGKKRPICLRRPARLRPMRAVSCWYGQSSRTRRLCQRTPMAAHPPVHAGQKEARLSLMSATPQTRFATCRRAPG